MVLLNIADSALAVASAGNDRAGTFLAQTLANIAGILALVTEQVSHGIRSSEQRQRCLDVADVARGEHQGIGPTQHVG